MWLELVTSNMTSSSFISCCRPSCNSLFTYKCWFESWPDQSIKAADDLSWPLRPLSFTFSCTNVIWMCTINCARQNLRIWRHRWKSVSGVWSTNIVLTPREKLLNSVIVVSLGCVCLFIQHICMDIDQNQSLLEWNLIEHFSVRVRTAGGAHGNKMLRILATQKQISRCLHTCDFLVTPKFREKRGWRRLERTAAILWYLFFKHWFYTLISTRREYTANIKSPTCLTIVLKVA